MKRKQLFEFEDLSWFPENLRNYGTDFLQFVSNRFDFYRAIVPVLKKGISKTKDGRVIDLASGGGGGWIKLAEHLQNDNIHFEVTFTDYFPNVSAFQKAIKQNPEVFSYKTEKVDASSVPEDLKGLRTMFLSFHHFVPTVAKQILQNAVDAKQPIAIFEGQERDVGHVIRFMLSPINVFLTTPFIRPFTFGRIFFTYIIPIVPLFVLWDGVVSALRTYSVSEMEEMIKTLSNTESFDWEVGKKKERGITIPYLLGYPKKDI